uniref:Uncharacterized protein n=1 Tax=Strongyloides venezuelensis TaxID=75913 RepID=A0A0K0FR58_STRVS
MIILYIIHIYMGKYIIGLLFEKVIIILIYTRNTILHKNFIFYVIALQIFQILIKFCFSNDFFWFYLLPV